MKHGIFISDVTVIKDSSFNIIFNDIINAKTDGIRFQSINSKNNLIASNLIYHTGNFNYPSLTDFYVVVPNTKSDVQIKNNFFTKNIQDAGISLSDYSILPGSPLIKTGYSNNMGVTFDFRYHSRTSLYDIGAMKYDANLDSILYTGNQSPLLFPNPVNNLLTIRYQSLTMNSIELNVFNLSGGIILHQTKQTYIPGLQEFQVAVDKFAAGVYVYSIQNGNQISYGKFIKL
jgi:hypothetical protein